MKRWIATNCLKPLLLLTVQSFGIFGWSQPHDSTNRFTTEIYIEAYYGYDFGNPGNQNRPEFLYSFHRHNEPNINFSLIQFNYSHNRVRSDLGIHFGTFSARNYAIEPGILKNIYQAKIGFQLSKKSNTWVDLGIMESHIGFESAKGGESWIASRSLLAENTPYYSAGIQFSHTTKDSTIYLAGLILNGWQRMTRKGANQLPAVGHQFKWTPNTKFTINSSSYIGNEYPEFQRRMCYFHNFYAKYERKQLGLIAGVDLGAEQRSYQSNYYGHWLSAILVARKKVGDNLSAAIRGEYFYDKNGIIIPTEKDVPFSNIGLSCNVDYTFDFPLKIRLEYRSFYNDRAYFTWGTKPTAVNHYVGIHLITHF
jgi:hypothetical protein